MELFLQITKRSFLMSEILFVVKYLELECSFSFCLCVYPVTTIRNLIDDQQMSAQLVRYSSFKLFHILWSFCALNVCKLLTPKKSFLYDLFKRLRDREKTFL